METNNNITGIPPLPPPVICGHAHGHNNIYSVHLSSAR